MIWRGGKGKNEAAAVQIGALTREVARLRPFEALARKQAVDIAVLKAHLGRARDNVAMLIQQAQDAAAGNGAPAPVVLFDHAPMVILVSERTGQDVVYDETTYRESR